MKKRRKAPSRMQPLSLHLLNNIERKEKEKVSMKLSVSKASVERDELGEEEEDIKDSASTTSSTTKRKTLRQLKVPVADQEKYPSKCNLKEA